MINPFKLRKNKLYVYDGSIVVVHHIRWWGDGSLYPEVSYYRLCDRTEDKLPNLHRVYWIDFIVNGKTYKEL